MSTTIRTKVNHTSGIPLGGLGTGSIEIKPDGTFNDSQIYNLGKWACRDGSLKAGDMPWTSADSLEFLIRTNQDNGKVLIRRLNVASDLNDLYHYSWAKNVEEIEFTGKYPVAELKYVDHSLPVAVSSTMFSPFIPHDSRASGTPGFHIVFTATNKTNRPVEVSMLGSLSNPLAWGAADRKLRSSVSKSGNNTAMSMETDAEMQLKSTLGSMCFSATGKDISYFAADFQQYRKGFNGPDPIGKYHQGMLYDLRDVGRLPNSSVGISPSELLRMSNEQVDEIPIEEAKKIALQLRQYASFGAVWRHMESCDPAMVSTQAGIRLFLKDCRFNLDRFTGQDRRRQTYGDAGLCSSFTLQPGETMQTVFTLAWFFPHHFSPLGQEVGHAYENWFKNAADVNKFMVANFEKHRKVTCSFAETLFDSTLPHEFADAWSGQLTTFPKCTWWTKDGNFAVWEGFGCCGFHTTDITYQGSFNILALFPDLQKRQMELGAKFQRPDGRVHHFFTPDLSKVDNGFDRVDMNQQFVLLVCRDYMWTNDRAYLRRLWPHILSAMENTAQLDKDGDGLPDHDTRRNTYDSWNFFGAPSYIASLWISALLAALWLAKEMKSAKHQKLWNNILKKAVVSFDKKLWNGEYYSLWVDGKKRDECCMTDQIDGEWFTQLIGLGHALQHDRIVKALKAIMCYDYRKEDGLINASYPDGAKPVMHTYRNLQAMAPWTGIEYAIGSMMLDFGLSAEGTEVIRNIHNRHLHAGRFWNHVECGDHYYRAMSSWAALLAATGFKINTPEQTVSFAPPAHGHEFHAPWVSSTGWGKFGLNGNTLTVQCLNGTLTFKTLLSNISGGAIRMQLDSKVIKARSVRTGAVVAVSCAAPVTIKSGQTLKIRAV